jgi:xylulokinase
MQGIDALRRIGIDTTQFIASGGGAKSDSGMQIRADILGVPFVRPRITEAGVLGAAMLAGLSTGVLGTSEEAATLFVKQDRLFEPDAKRHAIYLEKHALYQQIHPSLKPVLAKMNALP